MPIANAKPGLAKAAPKRIVAGRWPATGRLFSAEELPAERYHHREPGVASKTAICEFLHSPAVYRGWLDGKGEENTAALRFGSATHCALLEPRRFAESYAVEPDFGDRRLRGPRREHAAWMLANAGKPRVSAEEWDRIGAIKAAVRAHSRASRLLEGGFAEETILWRDPATKVRCKARTDYRVKVGSRWCLVDLKTTEDARDAEFLRSVITRRYHLQDALYRLGFDALPPRERIPIDDFVFVAVESKPTRGVHGVNVFYLDAAFLQQGIDLVVGVLPRMKECVESDHYPKYDEAIRELKLPKWAASKWAA